MSQANEARALRATEPGSARAAWALALGGLLAVAALPNAPAVGGVPAGDASLWLRLGGCQLVAALALAALHRRPGPAAVEWLAVCAPAWAHLSAFPPALAPLAWIPLGAALLRADGVGHAALLATLSAATQILGAAGWIFHYFERPLVPSLIALTAALALWVPASLAARGLVRRSALLLPLAAAAWPATEWLRGAVADPPLPGLFLSHANADTALAPLVAPLGEIGVSYVVSLIALAAGWLWLRRASWRLRSAALAAPLVLGVCGAWAPRPGPGPEAGDAARVCAVSDPHRLERRRPAFAGGGAAAVRALARRAVGTHRCDLVIFPEYSVELRERDVSTRRSDAGDPGAPVLLVGAWATLRGDGGRPSGVRNVVCRAEERGDRFACSDALDKAVFAPFGEAALFQDSPALAALGRWISHRATSGANLELVASRTTGDLRARARRVGAALCWEILVPGIFERRGLAPGAVALLVVPSDLNGFGGSREAIEQFRRAGRLHALRMRAPLLFAGTHGSFLLDARGEELPMAHRDHFLSIWEHPI